MTSIFKKTIDKFRNQYEQIFDTIQDGICVINKNRRIVNCNKTFALEVNMPTEEIIGKKCNEILPKYDDNLFKLHCKNQQCEIECQSSKIINNEIPKSFILEKIDKNNKKHYHRINIFPAKDNKGNIFQTVLIIKDITERETALKKIKKINKFNSLILDNAPVSIMTLNKKGDITSVNKYIKQITGSEFPKNSNIFKTHLIQKEGLIKNYKKLLTNGTPFSKDNCVYHKHDANKTKKYLNIVAVPLLSGNKKVDGALSMAVDNTESVLTKEKIEELNRDLERKVIHRTKQLDNVNKKLKTVLELKSKFISDASHELRTPLTIIQGNLDLTIQEILNKNRKVPEMFTLINKEIKRMTGILSDLTTLTNADADSEIINNEDINLESLINTVGNALTAVANKKNIEIKYRKSPKNLIVKGDEVQLEKLLFNIMRNSIK